MRAILSAAVVLAAVASQSRADFALRDGDTVAFLGDSITAARTYGKIVENYTLLRYPDRHVRFLNAGWGGDTAERALKRLDRDVLDHGATVVIVALGINDIGWGTKADAEHRQLYLDSLRGIIERCKERGARVFVCSAAATAEDPATAEGSFLEQMCDDGMALARDLGEGSIDVHRSMREVLKRVREAAAAEKEPKDRPTMHAPDGIHLNDLGQLAMAVAILKGLGAPSEVSSATVDLADPDRVEASGCRVLNVEVGEDGKSIKFDRLDDGLPINFGVLGALQFRFVPVPELLNGYTLTVKNLPEGKYDVFADGRNLGWFPADRLAQGVNIASATADGWEPGGPWDAQAALLIRITDARDQLSQAQQATDRYIPIHPELPEILRQADAADARLVDLQRSLVQPHPFHFLIRPSKAE
jgi:lysophospholipase L1-like esterase